MPSGKHRLPNPFRTIVWGFAGVILAGALVLMPPVSSAAGKPTSFLTALFTSASAVCVTGLVLHDTGTYWSLFGQGAILALIQIGGLGIVTVAASFALLSGRRIGLIERSTMQEAVAAPKMSGIVRLTLFILKTTFAAELMGAAVMAPVFCRDFGPAKGLWMALFHSVSAFCNAGFDLMGVKKPYSSLTAYAADPVINLAVLSLIIMGGIGFLTWDDMRTHGLRIKKYRMQSKAILSVTGFLILVPALCFFAFEFGDMPLKKRLLCSLFQSVTPRTAGFNTVDLPSMSEAGRMLTIILMQVGGSPGSTAGGMKTTTLAVMLACAVSVFRRRGSAQLFGRRIAPETVFAAAALLLMYPALCLGSALIISRTEGLPMLACLYETVSALSTVGLSLGITEGLSAVSKCMLIALMFLGRVGGLTFVFAMISAGSIQAGRLPQEKLTVG